MVYNSRYILHYLVRTGIWTKPDSLVNYRKVVIDVESAIDFLYRKCVSRHVQSQKSTFHSIDRFSGTLVNFGEFSTLVNQLLDFLTDHNLQPAFVYEGKHMEPPLYGLIAAHFNENSRLVESSLAYIINETRADQGDLARPNLALIIFKTIINSRRKINSNSIQVHQAFYSSYPILCKLARDMKCPVITGKGDFILMDVRAGFLLFDQFWVQLVEPWLSFKKFTIERSNLGSQIKSSKSRTCSKPSSPTNSKKKVDLSKQSSRKLSNVILNYNYLFLRQHPGLTTILAANLFPLMSIDFVSAYQKSLKRIKVSTTSMDESFKRGNISAYRRHHMAANGLEKLFDFLCGKRANILAEIIRSEAARLGSAFDDDFRMMINYYFMAYDFKARLKFTLLHQQDRREHIYIEDCLLNRECTAHYFLELVCCAIGRIGDISYNRYMQLEDVATKRSANSLINRHRSMLLSIFSGNQSHTAERFVSAGNRSRTDQHLPVKMVIVDRERREAVEYQLATTFDDPSFVKIRDKLSLKSIVTGQVNKTDCIQFMNIAFKSPGLTTLPEKLASIFKKYMETDSSPVRIELAIVSQLFEFCIQIASSSGDTYFNTNYAELIQRFRSATLNHYLFIEQQSLKKNQSKLDALLSIVNNGKMQVVSRIGQKLIPSSSDSRLSTGPIIHRTEISQKIALSRSTSKSRVNPTNLSAQIRHLIELLNATIESYCELNAFFNYPLPKLNLIAHYNPILIHNLIFYSYNPESDKVLVKLD